ncbi:MAG: energy-coupling factor transporter transmembrane protein EcfT [Firmicutes bacterium]|nr:energy-coupling factor transporter transmembrane protein EcfT [Bacillota bacterium]
MREMTLGQYYPSNSSVHKLDPRIKFLLTIAYIIMVFFVNTFFVYGALFVLIIVVCLLAKVPLLRLFRTLRGILILMLITVILTAVFSSGGEYAEPIASWWIFTIYIEGIIAAGMLGCRLILLILGPTLLTLTTTPVELTDGIERLLWPLSKIKIPVHEFAMIMSIALRFIPTLFEETDKIIAAQKARGADFESGNIFKRIKALVPILIPLFINSFRRADELADAMDSRCYNGSKGRTRMKVLKFRWRDLIAFLLVASIFFMVLLFRYNWWNCTWLTTFLGMVM